MQLRSWDMGTSTYYIPYSACSIGRFVEFFVGRSEEREHLLVDGLQTKHQGQRGLGSMSYMEQVDPFETLEHPAHRRAVRWFPQLAGDRLSRGFESLAYAVLGQPVDQQTQHHHQAQGRNPLGLLHKDRGGQKQRILEKTEAPLHTLLVFVGLDQLLVGEQRGIEHVGSYQEGSFAPRLPRAGRLVHAEGGQDLPLDLVRRHILTATSGPPALGLHDEHAP